MHVDRTEKLYVIFVTALLGVFAIAIGVGSIANGIQIPAPELRVDPRTVATPGVSPFGDPVEQRLREIGPNRYEVYILAQTWLYSPSNSKFKNKVTERRAYDILVVLS